MEKNSILLNKLKEFLEKLGIFWKTQGFANSTWFLLPKNVQKKAWLNLVLLVLYQESHDWLKVGDFFAEDDFDEEEDEDEDGEEEGEEEEDDPDFDPSKVKNPQECKQQ